MTDKWQFNRALLWLNASLEASVPLLQLKVQTVNDLLLMQDFGKTDGTVTRPVKHSTVNAVFIYGTIQITLTFFTHHQENNQPITSVSSSNIFS
jgi:hypothetical protein